MESVKQMMGRDNLIFLKHFQLGSKGGILKVLFTAHAWNGRFQKLGYIHFKSMKGKQEFKHYPCIGKS